MDAAAISLLVAAGGMAGILAGASIATRAARARIQYERLFDARLTAYLDILDYLRDPERGGEPDWTDRVINGYSPRVAILGTQRLRDIRFVTPQGNAHATGGTITAIDPDGVAHIDWDPTPLVTSRS